MNKNELIDSVAAGSSLTKAQSADAIDALVTTIQTALKEGDSVNLVGFGTFLVADRAARIGRNPRTGDEIQIAEARLPKFKPGKGFKDAVALPVKEVVVEEAKPSEKAEVKAKKKKKK